jgi:hypothetical protein
MAVSGSTGTLVSAGAPKPNAAVRSPQVCRRQRLRWGTSTPNRASINRNVEVWSKVRPHTIPPRLNGEITRHGTRKPRPIGNPPTNSPAVPGDGAGGATWSNWPSFSS